jgi:GAF domain-containing protein
LDTASTDQASELVSQAVAEGRTILHIPGASITGEASTSGTAEDTAEMAVPLKVEDRVLGVLHIQSDSEQVFPPEHIALAETVAAHLAIAVLEARNFASQQEEAWITTVLKNLLGNGVWPLLTTVSGFSGGTSTPATLLVIRNSPFPPSVKSRK